MNRDENGARAEWAETTLAMIRSLCNLNPNKGDFYYDGWLDIEDIREILDRE
jgi:hypothetical protein